MAAPQPPLAGRVCGRPPLRRSGVAAPMSSDLYGLGDRVLNASPKPVDSWSRKVLLTNEFFRGGRLGHHKALLDQLVDLVTKAHGAVAAVIGLVGFAIAGIRWAQRRRHPPCPRIPPTCQVLWSNAQGLHRPGLVTEGCEWPRALNSACRRDAPRAAQHVGAGEAVLRSVHRRAGRGAGHRVCVRAGGGPAPDRGASGVRQDDRGSEAHAPSSRCRPPRRLCPGTRDFPPCLVGEAAQADYRVAC